MAEDPHQEAINLLTYRINSLTTELTAARAKIERIDLSGIHTCHDKCQRWTCVLSRENKMLTEQLDGLRSGIDYASDQLHKVTEQRDRLAEAIITHRAKAFPLNGEDYDLELWQALQSLTTNAAGDQPTV